MNTLGVTRDIQDHVTRFCQGHRRFPDSREALVRRHQQDVWQYLRLLGRAPADADDLTQETFLLAFRKGVRSIDARATGAHLRRIARFLHLNQHRADTRRRASAERAWCDAIDDAWSAGRGEFTSDDYLAVLRRCRSRLRGRQHTVIELFYRNGFSRAEIATRMGMTENGVKTLLQRTRERLRRCIEGDQSDEND